MCSAFDLESLKYLVNKLKIKRIKIPSEKIKSLDQLQYLSNIKKKSFFQLECLALKKLKTQ